MLRRLLRRLTREPAPATAPINLIGDLSGDQGSTPAPIGLVSAPPAAAWTVARLEQIFRRCNEHPTDPQAQLEARHARHRLSSFWLEAPIDQLEILYRGAIGRAYRELLLGSLPGLPLAPDEASWKEGLARRLQEHFETPERPNLLLAVMPYCAPGRMRLENPLTSLPPWLQAEYGHCFDPELLRLTPPPPGLLQPAAASPNLTTTALAEPTEDQDQLPPPAPTPTTWTEPLPVVGELRGDEAFSRFQDSDFTDRMVGLINLFRLDPDDPEVIGELERLRRLLAQVWLDVSPASLEALYRSPMGMVYRELLASDFGALPTPAQDQGNVHALTEAAGDQEHPAMAQALLAVMPFHPQGRMRLGSGQDRLPVWLRDEFAALSGLRRAP